MYPLIILKFRLAIILALISPMLLLKVRRAVAMRKLFQLYPLQMQMCRTILFRTSPQNLQRLTVHSIQTQ